MAPQIRFSPKPDFTSPDEPYWEKLFWGMSVSWQSLLLSSSIHSFIHLLAHYWLACYSLIVLRGKALLFHVSAWIGSRCLGTNSLLRPNPVTIFFSAVVSLSGLLSLSSHSGLGIMSQPRSRILVPRLAKLIYNLKKRFSLAPTIALDI